jgi:hypothetical protein
MAVGDTVADQNQTAGSGTWTIQPAGTAEWVIHNIYFAGACTLSKSDAVDATVFATLPSAGSMLGLCIHLTNAVYLIITDTSTAINRMGYDGIITHT